MRATAVASETSAERASLGVLNQDGTSADALIAGFLAAAAERASVLFSPVQILIAGPGLGSHAFDGRCRQPGLGIARPRGFVRGAPIPGAAHVAVPGSFGVLSLLHAHDARLGLDKLAAPAAARARAIGADRRSAVLSRFGRIGASVLGDAQMARPLLSVAGPPEGGLLTEQDLADVRPEGAPPRRTALGTGFDVLVVPWSLRQGRYRPTEIIAVVDARGVLAVLAYAPDDEGFAVPDLELTMPREAAIVERGIPRTRPGEPLDAPAPVALVLYEEKPFLALGVSANQKLEPGAFARVAAERGAGGAAWLAAARQMSGASSAFGVMRGPSGGEPARLVSKETS